MPDWLDTPGEFLTVLSIGAVGLGLLLWLIKAQVAQLQTLTTRNGGSTVRDQLDRIELDIRDLRKTTDERENRLIDSVAKVHARIDEHISEHHLKGQ